MTDNSGYRRGRPLKTMTGAEGPQTITLPTEELVIDESAVDEEIVPQLMQSIASAILINPPTVTARKREDGSTEYRVVAGLQRAVAEKRLGKATVRCTLLDCEDPLALEQVSIDENLIRRHLSAAESAMLWGRRSEIEKKRGEREGTLSQDATASKQARRAAGLETGHDNGSARDQAEQTGESLAKIHRAMRRYGDLGPAVLESIVGTSLDTGVELDALAELPEHVQGDLVQRATVGEEVSAKKELLKAQRARQPTKPSAVDVEHAKQDFNAWKYKYREVWKEKGWTDKIDYLGWLLLDIIDGNFEIPDLEEENERADKGGWLNRLRGRKGD
jgi:ParB-like chromosome segregation protein Spo0J